jgi:hypothetical protein
MPVYSYTADFSELFGKETVAIADLPFAGQSYTWDFRSAILLAASEIPNPPGFVIGTQIQAWISAFVPDLVINASAFQGAGSPAKIGSYAWSNQGFLFTGGFLNFSKQYLGNICTQGVNDNTALSAPPIEFVVTLRPGFNAVPADEVLISLSGGDVSGASLSVTWLLERQYLSTLVPSVSIYSGYVT